jgi:two-component system NtrC family sensor kinase
MRIERRSALRLLTLMMIGSLALPAVLFAYVAWVNYVTIHRAADERIARGLDVLHEHTLKVLQTGELLMQEMAELTRDLSDRQIRADEARLHSRLQGLTDILPHVQSIWLIDSEGYPLLTDVAFPAPHRTLIDREYFQALVRKDEGIHVGAVLTPRLVGGPPFFTLNRRRSSPDGTFAGIIDVSLLPEEFEKFYARLGSRDGSYYAMVRADGAVLARYPAPPSRDIRLAAEAPLMAAVREKPAGGLFDGRGHVDGIVRRYGYRKVAGFPIYVVAGVDAAAIRAEWLSSFEGNLVFGLPATLILLATLFVALQRTRRLYAEADRRAAAESALRQSQRLEAIGRLTGGVAHDFNNLLMVIGGNVETLQRQPGKAAKAIDAILRATARGEALTRQLLAFSRQQALAPEPVDLARKLPEFVDVLRRSLRGDIEVALEIDQRNCVVRADPGELELALLNLAVNARDAMPQGGRLTIGVRPVTLGGDPAVEGLSGEFVEIVVRDTGSGIPAGILPRVFEPFFTTKEVGKGTGLGLSQVYGFAKQSGGTARIASIAGEGTEVMLYLPRTTEPPRAPAPAAQPSTTTERNATILVVEDNDEVADVARGYIELAGFDTRHAASADEARRLLATGTQVDLVFSDILMPGRLSGLDLARELRGTHPDLPVILATGYSDSAEAAVAEGFTVVRKPYGFERLKSLLETAFETVSAQSRI